MTQQVFNHPRELLPWLVNGTLEGAERRRVKEHLRSCLACRREVEELRDWRCEIRASASGSLPGEAGLERLLEAVETERRSSSRGPGLSRRSRLSRLRPAAWLLAAAAVVLAVGIGLQVTSFLSPAPSIERAGAREAPIRSLVDEGAGLERQDFRLRFAVSPAWREARFSLVVTARDLTLVHEAHNLAPGEYRVPTAALAELPVGARLFWRIEAVRSSGERISSPVFSVSLR